MALQLSNMLYASVENGDGFAGQRSSWPSICLYAQFKGRHLHLPLRLKPLYERLEGQHLDMLSFGFPLAAEL